MYRYRILAVATLSVIAFAACSDDQTLPVQPESRALESRAVLLVDDLECEVRPGALTRWDTPWWEMSYEELTDTIRSAGGHVFIGFKDAGTRAGVNDCGRVLVSHATIAQGRALVQELGGVIRRDYEGAPYISASIPPDLVPVLRANPIIDYVEPIFPGVRLAQETTWNVKRVQATSAWSYSTGSGVRVLIIDSGIASSHRDLNPAVIQACDGSDGFDSHGHGTQVAGVAAALNNTVDIIGVSYGVELWSSKDGDATPNPEHTACGVRFGRSNNTFAINISSSLTTNTSLIDEIKGAYNQDGLLIIAAAGNTSGGSVTFPANMAEVIAVTATDINDNRASFAAIGPEIELSAPGVDIKTTCLNGSTCFVDGTSFAAPHVAAAAAIVKSYRSGWSNIEIRQRLQDSAKPLGAASYFGHGLLQILNALGTLSVYIEGETYITTAGTYRYEAMPSGADGSYTYQWEVRYPEIGGGWGNLGMSKTQDLNIAEGDGDIELRVTVTSAGEAAQSTLNITNSIGCGTEIIC